MLPEPDRNRETELREHTSRERILKCEYRNDCSLRPFTSASQEIGTCFTGTVCLLYDSAVHAIRNR